MVMYCIAQLIEYINDLCYNSDCNVGKGGERFPTLLLG